MKKHLIKPGFELIFALSLIAIMGLPPLVFGQTTKDMEIKIMNGDTIINGKNIKDLSAADHQQAITDINKLGRPFGPGSLARHHLILKKRGGADTSAGQVIVEDRRFDIGGSADSTRRVFKFRMRGPNGKDSAFAFNYRMRDNPGDERLEGSEPDEFFHPRGFGRGFMRHRNVQNFDYSNTGSDGITTHASFRVNEASPEKVKEITGKEKSELEVKDLNIIPEFSSGKTILMFSLPAHTAAEAKLTDNDGKVIFADKVINGSFNKSFVLGLNGIYFLQVKQAGKVALKRIVKED